jgi:two-component system chemotaxis response regulator CheY
MDNVTVLIADDNMAVRSMLRKVMSSMGIEVVGEATDGFEAIELFYETNPTLVLLDILMPEKRGTEVLSEIMQNDNDAVVLMLSSINDEEVAEKCFNLGAKGYIQKNASLRDIKSMISDALREKMS